MVIFHSYVSLPEGTNLIPFSYKVLHKPASTQTLFLHQAIFAETNFYSN